MHASQPSGVLPSSGTVGLSILVRDSILFSLWESPLI